MRLSPSEAQTLLALVSDTGPSRSGWSIGLRDGAVLALAAAGLSTVEIAALKATAVTRSGRHVVVVVRRQPVTWLAVLPMELGERLLGWIAENQLGAKAQPIFQGIRGPLTHDGIRKILDRYRKQPVRRNR